MTKQSHYKQKSDDAGTKNPLKINLKIEKRLGIPP